MAERNNGTATTTEQELVITVVLVDIGGKTEMTFKQSGFTSVDSLNGHKGGWTECFDILDELLAAA